VLVFFIILIFVLSLALIKIKATITVDADVLKTSGKVCARIFSVPVFCRKIKVLFVNDKFKVEIETKEKTPKVNKSATPQKQKSKLNKKLKSVFLKRLVLTAFDKTEFEVLDTNLIFGIKDNAFLTAISFASIQAALNAGLAVVQSKINASPKLTTEADFSNSVFRIEGYSKINIRVLDIIKGLFVGLLHTLRYRRQQKQIQKRKAKLKVVAESRSISNGIYGSN